MEKLMRMALIALLVAGSATMAFADTTATDTVGTGYSVTDAVLMIDIAGKNQTTLHRESIWDQTVAGARAIATNYNYLADGGYLRYTAHGYTKLLKIMVESQTQDYVEGTLFVKTKSAKADGSLEATLGHFDTLSFTGIYSSYATPLVHDISGSDTWTGTSVDSGLFLEYGTDQTAPGVSSIVVIYTIMEQS
ncbi:MAG: hypothetical protein WCL50_00195 [Spirochaetota bacterium]